MRPVRSGKAYLVNGPPMNACVTSELAEDLERLLERFARDSGFSEREPVFVRFGAGIIGHHQVRRAADIYEVGGVGLERWHELWERAKKECSKCADQSTRIAKWKRQTRSNLGWRLYKTLQLFGRW